MNKEKNQNPKPPAESDEKLVAFGSLALSVERTNPLEWATAAAKAGYDLARANDPRVTKIGENVTTENVSNENVSNESDEKLRDELALNFRRNYQRIGKITTSGMAYWARMSNCFKSGWNAARANPVADPRVAELVERLRVLGQAMPPNAVSMEIQKALRKFEGRGT